MLLKEIKPSTAKIEHDKQVQWAIDYLRSGRIRKLVEEKLAEPDMPLSEEQKRTINEVQKLFE